MNSLFEAGETSHDVTRIPGIEWLRVLAISLVLLLHAKPISPCKTSSSPFLIYYPIAAFYDFVACLGVPLFFLVSLFLLEKNLRQRGGYLGARLKRLLTLFFFWTAIQFLVWGVTLITGTEAVQPLAWNSLLVTVLVGGPPLPSVGDSVIYFISDLLLLTFIHYFIREYLGSKEAKIVAIASCLVFFYVGPICRNLFFSTEQEGALASALDLDYYSPLNFLIFIPIAIWVNESCMKVPHERPIGSGEPRLRVLLGLYLLALVVEISIRLLLEMPFRVYARPSLALGAWVLVEIALRIRSAPSWILKVSTLTLGIFAIHKYWLLVMIAVFPDLPITAGPMFQNCRIDASDAIRLFLVAGLSCATAKTLACSSTFRRFVST
jgi:surface polysaccharide O-acyltransferase-like enzyme